MAEKKPEVEPEVVDVEELPVADTFAPDDEEYDETSAPADLGDEAEAEYEEHERESAGGEEL